MCPNKVKFHHFTNKWHTFRTPVSMISVEKQHDRRVTIFKMAHFNNWSGTNLIIIKKIDITHLNQPKRAMKHLNEFLPNTGMVSHLAASPSENTIKSFSSSLPSKNNRNVKQFKRKSEAVNRNASLQTNSIHHSYFHFC